MTRAFFPFLAFLGVTTINFTYFLQTGYEKDGNSDDNKSTNLVVGLILSLINLSLAIYSFLIEVLQYRNNTSW